MLIDVEDKIKKIEKHIEDLKQIRKDKTLGIVSEINIDGKIYGLKTALSILKNELF